MKRSEKDKEVNQHQKRLFDIIKSKVSENVRLADEIEDLLGIGQDAAYKRIRGEQELKFSELHKICAKYGVSIDEIFDYKSSQGALFNYAPVNIAEPESYIGYLKRLLGGMTALKSASDKEIIFSAQDIPFYHFTKFPELAFFKIYAWNDSINHKPMSYCKFCEHLEKDRIIDIYRQIDRAYMSIPSKEIWTDQTIDTTLRLLEHYYETGAFENKDAALFILRQLSELLDKVRKFADEETKGKIPFFLYISTVNLGNDYMLSRKETQLSCMVKLFTINAMATDNELFCSETKKWLEDLIVKSTQISGTSIKERIRFFQLSQCKIDDLRKKIESSESLRTCPSVTQNQS